MLRKSNPATKTSGEHSKPWVFMFLENELLIESKTRCNLKLNNLDEGS